MARGFQASSVPLSHAGSLSLPLPQSLCRHRGFLRRAVRRPKPGAVCENSGGRDFWICAGAVWGDHWDHPGGGGQLRGGGVKRWGCVRVRVLGGVCSVTGLRAGRESRSRKASPLTFSSPSPHTMGSRSRPLGTLGAGGNAGAGTSPTGRTSGRLGGLGDSAGPSTAGPSPPSAAAPRLTPAERFKPKPQPRSTRAAVSLWKGGSKRPESRMEACGERMRGARAAAGRASLSTPHLPSPCSQNPTRIRPPPAPPAAGALREM